MAWTVLMQHVGSIGLSHHHDTFSWSWQNGKFSCQPCTKVPWISTSWFRHKHLCKFKFVEASLFGSVAMTSFFTSKKGCCPSSKSGCFQKSQVSLQISGFQWCLQIFRNFETQVWIPPDIVPPIFPLMYQLVDGCNILERWSCSSQPEKHKPKQVSRDGYYI
jgi:hypothetical protein